MSRWQKYLFTCAAAIVTASGCAYFWMQHFVTTDDPFAVVNHPWQPAMLATHVLVAPVLVFAAGILVEAHVLRRLGQTRVNQRSGLLLLASILVMTLSGYLLQVTTHESWRRGWLVAHLVSGGTFAIAYVAHLVVSARAWRDQSASDASRAA